MSSLVLTVSAGGSVPSKSQSAFNMRIKVLSRDEKQYTRERPNDLQRVQRNAAPELHPFERAREYKRALNAVKLDRVFAKPFLGASLVALSWRCANFFIIAISFHKTKSP